MFCIFYYLLWKNKLVIYDRIIFLHNHKNSWDFWNHIQINIGFNAV